MSIKVRSIRYVRQILMIHFTKRLFRANASYTPYIISCRLGSKAKKPINIRNIHHHQKSIFASAPSLNMSTINQHPAISERLMNLMDYYADKPAGIWNQLYSSRIFLKDLFDSGCDTDDNRQFCRNWVKLRAYIVGNGGINELEKEAVSTELHCWCPSIPKEELIKLCDIGANLTVDEVKEICTKFTETTDLQTRKALLLNSLCGASLISLSVIGNDSPYKYGVNCEEIEAFSQIGSFLDIDPCTTKDIYSLYTLERRLRQKYDELLQ